MLTELKKTIHIVVDDINATPDVTMIADAVRHDKGTMTQCVGDFQVYQERGDALVAAASMGTPQKTYRVWTIHMHFIRDCAFEPKQKKLKWWSSPKGAFI